MAEQKKSSDLAPTTLMVAAIGSIAATAVVSRFGLAGTLMGAGLTPVVLMIVRELARRPVEQVASLRKAGKWTRWRQQQATAPDQEVDVPAAPPSAVHRRRIRWHVVGAASLVAFLAAVAVFTLPDLVAGRSIVADRDSTFFSSGDRSPAAVTTGTQENGVTAPARPTGTTTTPETETETVTVTTSTAPTETAPPAPVAPGTPPPAAPEPVPPAP